MDGWTVGFILIFGIAALVPSVWSVIGLTQGKREYWPAIGGIVWALVLMIFFYVGMAADWGGCDAQNASDAVRCEAASCTRPDPWGDQCTRCRGVAEGAFCPAGERPVFDFCEKFADGKIKQPWATWSDLSFIAAGLWILWFFRFYGGTSSAPNPMRCIGWLSVTYAMIIIFMGPPSMLLHASMKNWGGWFDSMSVVIWLSFNAAYVFYLCFWASFDKGRGLTRTLGVLLPALGLVLFFGILGWFVPDSRLFGYLVAGGLWGIFEFYFLIRQWWFKDSVVYIRTTWVFGLNLITLAVTMTIWLFFNADVVSAANCQARESFPGHAFFHILASFATILTFWSFATEERVTSGS